MSKYFFFAFAFVFQCHFLHYYFLILKGNFFFHLVKETRFEIKIVMMAVFSGVKDHTHKEKTGENDGRKKYNGQCEERNRKDKNVYS